MQLLEGNLTKAEAAVLIARRALELAVEQAAAAGVLFHETMQPVKIQVAAQHGVDSPALHAIGYKQKSERRRPARRAPAASRRTVERPGALGRFGERVAKTPWLTGSA